MTSPQALSGPTPSPIELMFDSEHENHYYNYYFFFSWGKGGKGGRVVNDEKKKRSTCMHYMGSTCMQREVPCTPSLTSPRAQTLHPTLLPGGRP